MIDWKKVTDNELVTILLIAERAQRIATQSGVVTTVHEWEMDIAACHTLCPLRLEDLSKADDFNFNHDVFGIRHHIDRKTGKLEDFDPRYSK